MVNNLVYSIPYISYSIPCDKLSVYNASNLLPVCREWPELPYTGSARVRTRMSRTARRERCVRSHVCWEYRIAEVIYKG